MSLLQDTLELLRQRLNDHFQVADPATDEWVVLSNLADQEGRLLEQTRNKVVLFLANIQQDTTISTWQPTAPLTPDRFAVVAPPIYVNLFLLVYANFSGANYAQGVGMISDTIQFFQQNPVFDHANMPSLPSPIDKLAFELTNLDAVGLNYLMSLAGVKYLPSLYYRVRLIPFRSNAMQQQVSAVRGDDTQGQPDDTLQPLEPGVAA